jgi:hypothetical protein
VAAAAGEVVGEQRMGEEMLVNFLAGSGDYRRRPAPTGSQWRKILAPALRQSSARWLMVRLSMLEEEAMRSRWLY